VVGWSQPATANRHLPSIGTWQRPSTTFAAWAVTPARARKSPRSPNRVPPFSDLPGTVRISCWRYVAYLCSHWQLATSSPLHRPKPLLCGKRPVARPLGGYFRIVHFSLYVCLPVSFVYRHSLRLLVIRRSIDRCPRLHFITVGPASPSWAPPVSSSDALHQKVILPRRDGERTRFIAWLLSVSIHC